MPPPPLLAFLLALTCLASWAHAADRVYWANGLTTNTSSRMAYANLNGSGGANISTAGVATGQPRGVAIDIVAGKIFFTLPDNNRVSFTNLDGSGGGGNLTTTGATVNRPNAAAVYPALGKVYWANEFGDRISFANSDNTGGAGNLVTTGATTDVTIGPTVDSVSNRIYWANANPVNVISWANVNGSGGGNINTAGATVDNPHGVAIDPVTNRIYWANVTGQRISWASLSGSGGGNLVTTGATVSTPVGVAIDTDTRRIYWGNWGANSISWANLDGSGGGNLSTSGATQNGSRSPALLKTPQGTGAPSISGGTTIGSVLTCSLGSWAPDLLGQVLYRVPGTFTYSWTLNGTTIPGATSSTHTTSAAGDYRCTVTGSNPAGSAAQTSAVKTVTPAAPAAPTLSATPGTGSVHLSWVPGSNGGAAITNYKIYRGTTSGGESLLTTVGNVTTFDDTTVTNGTNYFYKASAVNSIGEGAQSNEVSARPTPSISINDVSAFETNSGQTDFNFTVSLSSASSQTVTVAYATQDGTATTAGSDYASASNTLTFTAGQTSKTVTVKVNGDTTFEPDEGFTVNLSSPTNSSIADGAGLGTVRNEDSQPQISISDVAAAETNSGTTNFTFTASLSNPSSQTVTVSRATQDGSATSADSDYTSQSASTLSFAPGQTQVQTTIAVTGDAKFEPDETFDVNLTSPSNATIADGTGVGTIQNDDAVPQAVVNDVTHAEGNSGTTSYVFTVALSNPSAQSVTVDYGTEDDTATTAGADYTAASGTLTFSSGQTAKTVTVNANGDTLNELDESFRLKLTAPTNATIADATGVGTIQNDDAVPALSVNDVTHAEGNSGSANMTFTVSLSAASGQTVSVAYATHDGTATTAGSDYTATSGTLTLTPGQTAKTVDVPVHGDTTTEPDEALTLKLTSPANATIADDTGAGTIQNDDAVPQISINDVSHLEGAAGTTTDFAFTASLSHASSQPVTVDISTEDGSATVADQDFQALAPLQLTFPAGATQATASVTANGDGTNETDESFSVVLASPVQATIADGTGTGTIQNDDAQPVISVDDVAVLEGNSGETDINFTLTLSHPSSTPVSVHYATQNGSAVAGSDYTAKSGTEPFAAGEVSKQVTVKATGDIDAEGNETFTLELSNPTSATIGDGSGQGVIQNDDLKYARPKAATPMIASLVHAYQPCVAPNRVHDGTLVPGGSCAPPSQASPNLTSGTPDANGATANFIGSVRLRVSSGDVAIEANLSDVRCQGPVLSEPVCSAPNLGAGPDYAGELNLKLSLRITDKANAPVGGGQSDQGTGEDITFPAAIPCTATVSPATGGQCDLVTTANGLVPGAVSSGLRSIWELGKVEVDDAGPDGLLSTPEGADPFAVQGVFAP